MKSERLFWPLVGLLVASVGWLGVRSAMGETQTWDEGIHISAGYAYLTRADFSWNVEHPPLVKLMCAAPLLWLGLDARPFNEKGERKSQVEYGIDFLYRNRRHADTILIAARSMNIALLLAFTIAFAWWVRRRFGWQAGILAAALCGFDPNLIAHGRYITTDVPLTAFFFFSCMLWVEYLERGGQKRLLAASLAVAIAMVVKFSAVLLAPPLILLFAAAWLRRPQEFGVKRAALALAVLAGVVLAVILVVYWPETVRAWKQRGPLLAAKADPNLPIVLKAARWLHLPDHSYARGLNDVVTHNEGGHESYLLGARSSKGWWYYFPVVFGVKSTIAALLALIAICAAGLWAARGLSRDLLSVLRRIPLIALGLALPPAIYFASSMTSGINLGMRHILPIYPFLYAGAAAVLSGVPMRRLALAAMLVLGATQIGECAWITPDYLAFFNRIAGGPGRGPEYLVDSNIDWGQDVKKLVRYLDTQGTRKARIFYFGNAQMRYYGVDEIGWPEPLDQKGWDDIDEICVANVTPLYGIYVPLQSLAPLRLREPDAKIGWSMYVYDLRKKKNGQFR